MSFVLQPWHILLATICSLANHRQQQIIDFQNAQIQALLKKLRRKCVLLDDDQHRLLAVKGHGRDMSAQAGHCTEAGICARLRDGGEAISD